MSFDTVPPEAHPSITPEAVLELVREAQVYRPGLKALFVVNRQVVRSIIGREVRAAIGELNMPVLAAGLAQRVVFAETAGNGQLSREIDVHGAAAREVAGVTAELQRWAP